MICNLIHLWSLTLEEIVLIFLYWLKFDSCPNMLSLLEKVPWASEKEYILCSTWVESSVDVYKVYLINMSFNYNTSLFYLNDLLKGKPRGWKSLITIVLVLVWICVYILQYLLDVRVMLSVYPHSICLEYLLASFYPKVASILF